MSETFRHRLRVRYNECDPQGVVFNANYLTYFDITMGELWRELGGYHAMVDAGVDMVVAEATIRYLAPLYDELLSEARLAPDQDWPSTLRTLRERRRARISMQSKVSDAAGTTVATLAARFALILAPTAADAMA